MFRMRRVGFCLALPLLSLLLASCASKKEIESRITGRWGPNPAIQSSDVSDTLDRQMTILQYIASRSAIGTFHSETKEATYYWPTTPSEWMRVTKAGFNIGREDCEVYLQNLFRMARERQRNDGLLNAGSVVSNAILQATSATKAISIVGASFNMATSFNDAIFDSYLFSQAPGLIGEKVKDVQAKYRTTIEEKPASIATPEDAYNAIQNYYSYCLPHAIEGLLLQKVADSKPAADPAPTPKKSADPAPAGAADAPTPPAKPQTPPASKSPAAVLNGRIKLQ